MLEEQYRIIASSRRLDQAFGIFGIARKNDVPARRMRVHGFRAHRMEGPALDSSTAGHAHDQRVGPDSITSPTHGGNLIAHLHEGGPRVIRKLDFDDRLVSAKRHTAGNTHNTGFGERRILYAIRVKIRQTARNAEYTALWIRDILAPHDDLRVALHLFPETSIEGFHHRNRIFGNIYRLFLLKEGRFVAVNVCGDMTGFRLRSFSGFIGGLVDFGLNLRAQLRDVVLGQNLVFEQVLFR